MPDSPLSQSFVAAMARPRAPSWRAADDIYVDAVSDTFQDVDVRIVALPTFVLGSHCQLLLIIRASCGSDRR